MKSLHIKASIFILGILGISIAQINGNSSGASSPKTGAPNETTCTSCHSGSSVVTSGNQHARIRLNGNFSGNGYIPDSTYTLTLTYAETGKSTFGFQMTALSGGKAAGTFTASTRTSTFSSSVNGSTRYYIEHNATGSSGIATDSTAWTFQWKAPSTNMGEITFYAALNSTNDNGNSNGDVIYNKTFKINPSTLLPKATATLKSNLPCAGSLINLEGSSTNNASSYSWTFPNGVPSSSTQQNPQVRYAAAGPQIAILKTTNSKGTSLNDTLKITILDAAIKPNMNIRTATVVLCLGDTLEFNIGTSQKHTYTWSNGATGRTNLVDTNGWVGVTALRDNGCSVKSDSVFVVGIPKPKFTVNYGFSNDSICVKENLLVILSNKGLADSYSRVSDKGPYFRDSFLTFPVNKGANSFQFWAKSKIGCIAAPSKERIITGIDTPTAPIISTPVRLIDRIQFTWNHVPFSESFQYSIDNGKTWSETDSGLNNRVQWILLDSATQTVNFWLRARTGIYCGFSQIGKTSQKGAGCKEPNWKLTTSNPISCFDSLAQIQISGLHALNSYSLKVNGKAINDTAYSEIIRANKSFTVSLRDSQQLLCGFFEKTATVSVDTPAIITTQYPHKAEVIFCGIADSAAMPLSFTNYQTDQTYWGSKNGTTQKLIESNVLKLGMGSQIVQIWALSANGCKSAIDSIFTFVESDADAGFNAEWVSDYTYRYSAIETDTLDFRHIWKDSITGQVLNNTNVAEIILDYSNVGDVNVFISHELQSKKLQSFSQNADTFCNYSSTKMILIRNMNAEIIGKQMPQIIPNPSKSTANLTCLGCTGNEEINVWSVDGAFMGAFTIENLNKKPLSNGIYILRIGSQNESNLQKIIIGN